MLLFIITSLPTGATFAFCSHGEKLPRQGGLPGVVQRVTRLSKLPRGNEKLANSYRRQTVHRGKVDPGVSELPRDHVKRPLGFQMSRY